MCDPFPNLENGFVNCTNNQFVSGTICTSRCEPGYSLVGTRDRKCLPIAQWDGLSASCIREYIVTSNEHYQPGKICKHFLRND